MCKKDVKRLSEALFLGALLLILFFLRPYQIVKSPIHPCVVPMLFRFPGAFKPKRITAVEFVMGSRSSSTFLQKILDSSLAGRRPLDEMLKLTQDLTKHKLVSFKTKYVQIDNLIFRFHYRITVALLLIGVALVSSQEYIGEHIKCIHSAKKEIVAVIERFCFFMATFTVTKLHNSSTLNGEIAHPGVGPYVESNNDEIIKHTYYQWVPFVLFFQAISFYLPHLIWREVEKGKLKRLLDGLREIDMINTSFKRKSFDRVHLQFKNRLYINRSWSISLIVCEVLNLLNLIFQIYITDVFLGYQFMGLGPKVYWDPKGDEFNPLDVVFPKVTKCSFRKFGPSGSIQYHDIMCVMALNIVNEKLYTVLWFWYVILFTLSVLVLLWRLISFILRKFIPFNLFVFKITALGNINKTNLVTVMRHLNFGEWMFLRYLASNMPANLFDELMADVAESYEKMYIFPDPEPEPEEETKKPLVDL